MKLCSLATSPYRPNIQVYTLVGETGIGKSYAVYSRFPNAYRPLLGNSGIWFDGYHGQDVILLEEFKGQIQLQKLLQLLDSYPVLLEVKGGSIPAMYTKVFITSNYDANQWYADEKFKRNSEFQALYRRVGYCRGNTTNYIYATDRKELNSKLDIALNPHETDTNTTTTDTQIMDLDNDNTALKRTESIIIDD